MKTRQNLPHFDGSTKIASSSSSETRIHYKNKNVARNGNFFDIIHAKLRIKFEERKINENTYSTPAANQSLDKNLI